MKPQRGVTVVFALVGLIACETAPGRVATELPELGIQAEGAVEASFRVGPFAGGQQSVWVRLTGVEGEVGAYQARLEFDASRITLERAAITDDQGSGDFGVLNDNEGGQGVLRFAGFSIEGFEVRDVLELRFRTPRALQAGDLRLELDVIGTPEGSEVSTDELAVASEMQPLAKLELGR